MSKRKSDSGAAAAHADKKMATANGAAAAAAAPAAAAAAAAASADPTDDELLAVAWELAHRAGNLIRACVYKPKVITVKSTAVDNATETDVACERLIIEGVKSRYPSHEFVAEESHKTEGAYTCSDATTWIIDPIDGTTNFVHGLPFVCVSVAVMVRRVVRVAVIHAPLLHETYHAIAGRGSFVTAVLPPAWNAQPGSAQETAAASVVPPAPQYAARAVGATGAFTPSVTFPSAAADANARLLGTTQRLAVSGCKALEKCALIVEFGYERNALGIDLIADMVKGVLNRTIHAVRSFGSCALNMCQVAAGRADAYWEGKDTFRGPKPWDLAAAGVVVTEAGGHLTDIDGSAFSIWSGRLLAAGSAELGALIAAAKGATDAAVYKHHGVPQPKLVSLPPTDSSAPAAAIAAAK